MKILLDPLIYWFENDENCEEKLGYWSKVINIIEKYFNIKYVSSANILKILMRLNKEPSKLFKEQEGLKQSLIKKIFNNLDYPNNIIEKEDVHFSLPTNFNITNNVLVDKCFSNIVSFIASSSEEYILLLSMSNHGVRIDITNLFVVNHISGEIDSKITDLMVNKKYLKDGLAVPTLSNPIPFDDLCDHFLDLQNDLKKYDNPKSVFLRVTKEVALRNLYVFDKVITKKNTSSEHQRKIYTYQKHHYLSADFETGSFELHDRKGKHQMEISYTGNQTAPKDKTGKHDIIV